MKIAIIGLITKEISKDSLGGTEIFTYLLVEGLVKKGHNVTLYCAKGSKTSAQTQIEICDPSWAIGKESSAEFVYPLTLVEMQKVLSDHRNNPYDLIHVSMPKDFMATFFAANFNIPIVHTMHRDFFEREKIFKIYEKIGISKNEYFVFVAKHAYEKSLYKNNTTYIYNGLDLDMFPFSKESGVNFLWFSRIDPLKGAKEAILAAKEAECKLNIVGDIDRPEYQKYFQDEIEPLLTQDIVYQKSPPHEKKVHMYQNAKALLFPTLWEEPFPYIILEALASGTPVIAFARGSLVETIKDGQNGFLVNPSEDDKRGDFLIKETGIKGFTEAIRKINSLSNAQYLQMKANARESVEGNFSATRMVEQYTALYKKLTNQ